MQGACSAGQHDQELGESRRQPDNGGPRQCLKEALVVVPVINLCSSRRARLAHLNHIFHLGIDHD